MTAFDAPRYLPVENAAPLRTAGRCLAARPVAAVVSLLAASTLVLVALGLTVLLDNLPRVVEGLVERTSVAVVLNADLTRAEAEALEVRLLALPTVGTATLRAREDAIAALATDGVAVPRGQNPLPDVLVASLRIDERARPVGPRFAALAEAAGALPGVHSVSFDQRWVKTLTAWQDALATVRESVGIVALSSVAVLLFCVSYLAGSAFADDAAGVVPTSALVSIGMLLAVAAGAIALLAGWGATTSLADPLSAEWKAVAVSIVRIDVRVVVATLVVGAVVMVGGTSASAARR